MLNKGIGLDYNITEPDNDKEKFLIGSLSGHCFYLIGYLLVN